MMSATSGLGAKDRAHARRLILKAAGVLMDHPAALHYSQDMALRWEGIHHEIIPWTSAGRLNGNYIRHGDCSSTATWLLWLALNHHFHIRDVVNGEGWQAGFTGTMLAHGEAVHLSQLQVGDCVIYGPSSGHTEHVTISIGGRRVFSHGSEAGPFLLEYNYRPDIIGARRYI